MNLDGLIKDYFGTGCTLPFIEMFDKESIHCVYKDIVNTLRKHPDIELSILHALSYCFYEILDNVITHSTKSSGIVATKYCKEKSKIQIMVADDGIGIRDSLAENEKYQDITEAEALSKCFLDKVTDGKGLGFGLYSTACLIRHAGIVLILHSGKHILVSDGINEEIKETTFWQGTVIYFELQSDKEIDPNSVLENRTDAVSEFNDEFYEDSDFDNLW